ncbi:MAG: beta-ketoacyl synthase chain length factor [Rhodanobacter sp.]
MNVHRLFVEGIGLWSPHLADFAALRGVLSGAAPNPPAPRPGAAILPPNERRRAPPSVLLAVEVAQQAVTMSGRDAATMPCVFASAHGDQATTDYMCATLAHHPLELSPTRFHNSVHNAAAGYWTIAVDCHAASTAIAAQRASFGAGLLEAASQSLCDAQPILFVCSDTVGAGALREVTCCTEAFGSALVLAPEPTGNTLAQIDLQLTSARPDTPLAEPLAAWRASNPSATALALLALLAQGSGSCQLAAAAALGLRIDLERVA